MFRDWEYVYAIYQEASFSKAAQKMFITQPALSNKIKKIEQRIGAQLFRRDVGSGSVQLTSVGRHYIEASEEIMMLEQRLSDYVAQKTKNDKKVIALGGSSYSCTYIIPKMAADFLKAEPNYTVKVIEGSIDVLSQHLQLEEVDFIVNVVEALPTNEFSNFLYGMDEIILAVPASFSINQQLKEYKLVPEQILSGISIEDNKHRVDLSAFASEKFLMLKKGNFSYSKALSMCHQAGFHPNVSMYLDQMLTAYFLSANGHGIAFIQSWMLNFVPLADRLCFYCINNKKCFCPLHISYKKKTSYSTTVNDFLTFIKTYTPRNA